MSTISKTRYMKNTRSAFLQEKSKKAAKLLFIFLPGVFFLLWPSLPAAEGKILSPQGLEIALFSVLNSTPQKVWPNKYYPGDILPEKVEQYVLEYLLDSPLISVTRLDEPGTAQWLSGERRYKDLGLFFEIYRFSLYKNTVVGAKYGARVSLRMSVYDSFSGEKIYSQTYSSQNSRWTPEFRPDTWMSPQGQKVTTYWQSFTESPYWAALQDATRQALDDLTQGYTGYQIAGRILSPTEDSTEEDRKYIISLGKRHSLRQGELLGVVRSDTYITVDPENPVVLMPKLVGKVRVLFLKDQEAIVRVIAEDPENPIELRDLVLLPLFGARKGEW